MKAIEKYGGKFLFVPLSPLLAIVVVVVELGDNDSLSTEIVKFESGFALKDGLAGVRIRPVLSIV